MRSPGADARAPRTRARRHAGRAARAPARSVDGPPRRYYTAVRIGVPAPATVSVVARLVGINHVALEVGDLDEALAWYGQFFELELRGRIGAQMAFVDMGDQFLALARDSTPHVDRERHFGLVVDDKGAVRVAREAAGVDLTRAP